MGKVYSHLLWEATAPVGTVDGPSVPDSELWVVRTVTIQAPGDRYSAPAGWELADNLFLPICGWAQGQHSGGFFYTWEGRHVIEPEQSLVAFVGSDFYSWRVSGYKLTLP